MYNFMYNFMYNLKFFLLKRETIICVLLFCIIVFIYSGTLKYNFINFDDPVYVTDNPAVQKGISFESISWAFGIHNNICMYWQPIAWISHMLDFEFFGLDPGKHHRTSIILHILNAILLFFILNNTTGAIWKSAVAAALFAIHPVNVDSVSWIAERKTILSGFFWLLAMLSYYFYTKNLKKKVYIAVLFFFTLGMLSKPVMITFPCALLLLDVWPLSRISFQRGLFSLSIALKLIIEKIPFLIISGLWFITPFLSKTLLANETLPNTISYSLRISNAIVAYSKYIFKFYWPFNLSIHYPYPTSIPLSKTLAALLFITGLTLFFLYHYKKKPFLIIGWLWFIGVLVPSSGIILGTLWPEMADRWAYLPYIGLCIISVWGIPELNFIKITDSKILIILIILVLSFYSSIAKLQTKHWKNSITIFEHALIVSAYNFLPHQNIATELVSQGKYNKAIEHIEIILENEPENIDANYNIGLIYFKKGQNDKALSFLKKTINLNPDFLNAYIAIGEILVKTRQFNKALEIYQKALLTKTKNIELYYNISLVLEKLKRIEEAELTLIKLLGTRPSHTKGNLLYANILLTRKNYEKALLYYQHAALTDTLSVKAFNGIGISYALLGEYEKSIEAFKKVLTIDPKNKKAQLNLQKTILLNLAIGN